MIRGRRPCAAWVAAMALVWLAAGVGIGFWFGAHSDLCDPSVSVVVYRVEGIAGGRLR